MVDSQSGGDPRSPRHADPWWMNDPESMDDTHVFSRRALDDELRQERAAGGPRRGLSEDATGSYEPTHAMRLEDLEDEAADPSSAARDRARVRRAATDDGSAVLSASDRWAHDADSSARRTRDDSDQSFQEGRYAAADSRRATRAARHEERGEYRRSAFWTVLGALVPGLGLWASRHHSRRRAGLVVTGLALAGLTAVVLTGFAKPALVASVAVRPRLLNVISIAVPLLAVLLVGLLVVTHLDIRPRRITRTQRWISAVLVGTLSLAIAAPMAIAARYAHDEAAALGKIFSESRSGTRPAIDYNQSVDEIWRQKPRVNVLLVGGDDSSSRNYRAHGEMNTDTMMVASIDTQTGNTTIIQIPRNLASLPFPEDSPLHKIYPKGFSNGHGDDSDFFANAVWSTVQNDHKDAMGATDYPGADALKLGIGEALGLNIDYFVMLDIDGLQKFVDAVGGVTVNVNERLPIAGNTEGKEPTGYIEIGPDQHLNGYRAMWYARSRSASTDYDRMGRQSCLIKAVLDQVSPQTVLTRFETIASASGDMVVSDIPQGMLPAFVALVIRMRGANVNRLLFTQGKNGFVAFDPNYSLMRNQVKDAIADASNVSNRNRPVTSASPRPSRTATATPKPSPTPSPSSSPTPTRVSQSVTDVCAYNPVQPQ